MLKLQKQRMSYIKARHHQTTVVHERVKKLDGCIVYDDEVDLVCTACDGLSVCVEIVLFTLIEAKFKAKKG